MLVWMGMAECREEGFYDDIFLCGNDSKRYLTVVRIGYGRK